MKNNNSYIASYIQNLVCWCPGDVELQGSVRDLLTYWTVDCWNNYYVSR